MALSSSSTVTTALAQYNDNLRYWVSASAAENLYEAILWLKANRARVAASAGTSFSFSDLEGLEKEVRSHVPSATASASRASFVRGRVRSSYVSNTDRGIV